MALIPIDTLHRQVLQLLDKITPPGGLELLSYKRDRSIALIHVENDRYRVIERGFEEQESLVDSAHLSRVLKTMIKQEFPRSHKVRLFKFSSPQELKGPRQRIQA